MAKLKNHGYIGTWKFEKPREPGENTLLYMPMDGDVENKVDGSQGTWSGTPTYYTLDSGIKAVHSNSSHYVLTPTIANNTPLTVSCWIYQNSGDPIVRADSRSGTRSFPQLSIGSNKKGAVRFHYNGTGYGGENSVAIDGRQNIVGIFGPNGFTGYVNCEKIFESSFNSYLWRTQQWGIGYDQFMMNVPGDGYYSDLIIENKMRTDKERILYYNHNKSKYGL